MKRQHQQLLDAALSSCRAAWPIVLTTWLAACGGGSDSQASLASAAPQPRAVDPGTWVVMGSSTAAGTGASAGQSWAALLQTSVQGKGIQIINIAKGGSTTYQGLSTTVAPTPNRPLPDPSANIDQALSRHPSLILVAYPTNDTAIGYTVEETVANLLAIRRQALTNSTAVVVVSTQPRNLSEFQLSQLPLIDVQLSTAAGACFVDVRTRLADVNGQFAPQYDSGDGVHPNDAGHRLIAIQVQAALSNPACIPNNTQLANLHL
ncbi:MAG: SGNH/GDSL hydrolase family protein [Polaromonas sp.]|nr:SGNH/GDSL hydrolase family protein [Polaromonas sp.]